MPGSCPNLVALLLCDRAFQQAGTGTWCIIGAFDTVNVPDVPFTYPGFSIFVALSDFRGDAMVQLDIRDEAGAFVKAVRGKVPRIPLGLFQYVFPVPEIEFKTTGVHSLELLADGEIVTVRSFRVQSMKPDSEAEAKQAEALLEEYREQVAKAAVDVWSERSDAEPIGLIVAAEAGQQPAFRQTFESTFGAPPPQMTFVGILDRATALRLAGDQAAQAETWLDHEPEGFGRVLRVLIVTANAFRFAYHRVDGEA
jgi:hypothetical protein